MNKIELYNYDNLDILADCLWARTFNCIYCDPVYQDKDYKKWIGWCVPILEMNGIIYIQTDYHTVTEIKLVLDSWGLTFINWLIYIQEWGGTSERFFPRKHDDILMYADGKNYKFYPERIQIPKVTAGTAFDKKGTGLKTPCDVFYDLGNFSTISKEREKLNDKCIQWQKPLKLMNRLLLPVTDENDNVFDPFLGSGTTAIWTLENRRNCVGIEKDKDIYKLAKRRILKRLSEMQSSGVLKGYKEYASDRSTVYEYLFS